MRKNFITEKGSLSLLLWFAHPCLLLGEARAPVPQAGLYAGAPQPEWGVQTQGCSSKWAFCEEGSSTTKKRGWQEEETAAPKKPEIVRLTEEQKKEGFRVERRGNSVLVLHRNKWIGLFPYARDIDHIVQQVVERRRSKLKESIDKNAT